MCRSVWSGLRGSLSLMYSSMHSPGRGVNRVERTLLNFFMWGGVRGGCFRALGRYFAGDFGGGDEAQMGGSAAKFRGFWAESGCGEAIQRTADMGELTGRKNFEKIFKTEAKNLKIGA